MHKTKLLPQLLRAARPAAGGLPRGMVTTGSSQSEHRAATPATPVSSADAFDLRGDVSGAWALDGPAEYMNVRGMAPRGPLLT